MKETEASLPFEEGVGKGLATYGSRLAAFIFIAGLGFVPFAWLWLKENGLLTGFVFDLVSVIYRALPGLLLIFLVGKYVIRKLEPVMRFSQHPLVASIAKILVVAFPFAARAYRVSAKNRETAARR